MATGSVSKKSPVSGKGQKTLFSFFQKSSNIPKPESISSKSLSNEAIQYRAETPSKLNGSNSSDLLTPQISKHSPRQSDMEEQSPPSLGTPEPSSQGAPQSTPTRVGRRSYCRMMVIDSDDSDIAAEDSDDDWAKKVNEAEESSDGDENSDFVDEDDEHVEKSAEQKNRSKIISSNSSAKYKSNVRQTPPANRTPNARSTKSTGNTDEFEGYNSRSNSLSPASLVVNSLSKYSKHSDYDAEPLTPTNRGIPPPKKVKVTEDPERYKWLANIKDADGNAPDHPDYDPRTIFVPNSAWAKFTPFEKQYWEVKQNLWNTVVFFKKGKFYELYENDAEIAHRQFDLKLAGGGRANMSLCGVPEMSFDYWASAFIAKGYKVARVDQSETALGKELRDIAAKKKEEKIIRRELSCVLTGGTLTDATMLVSDLSQYCMAIKQEGLNFAACFVDTATSHFYIANFTDKSSDYPMLETLMAQTRPKELIIARGNLEKYALKVIKNNTSVDTLWETIKPDSEFWDCDTARREIEYGTIFHQEESDEVVNNTPVPPVLAKALANSDLAASAVGGLVWYLRTLKLDKQLLSLGQFSNYDASATSNGKTMVIDGQTLQNLEIFANTWDGGVDGTLFKLINKCVTPFGKRRLRNWVAHPLQQAADIALRADVVDMFIAQDEVANTLGERLIGLPDTERMLSRVHAGNLQPKDFVRLVSGLERISNLLKWLDGLKQQLPQLSPFISCGEEITTAIEPWMTCFDHLKAKNDNALVPEPGIDSVFDGTNQAVTDAENNLHDLLKQYRKDFKSNSLEYKDSGKEIFLIEVPSKLVKQVPRDWQQMGATAKFKRYWSPEGKHLVRVLQEAQERHKVSSQLCQQKLYSQFCSASNYDVFMEATKVLSAIDCLLSLAKVSQNMVVHCRPTLLSTKDDNSLTNNRTFIEFTEMRHPVATSTTFIPNDVRLGGTDSSFSLLTGANAAGKSTILRTTSCSILLAQLGCHVPSRTAQLTPVDRIMTRLGASDNIFAGKSTFHLELSETERILSEATSRSLVVIDELGRGGSSSDGFAIAESVLHHLATHINCVGFFATHYATLYDCFANHPNIKPQRMAIEVDQVSREVTFLYTLEDGRSEGSFGMNVATMCGVASSIVAAAEQAAEEFEHTSMLKKQANERSEHVPLGLQSDLCALLKNEIGENAVNAMVAMALSCRDL